MRNCSLAILTFFCLTAGLGAQESIVRNGTFEQLDEKGAPRHWQAGRIEVLPDGTHALLVPFTWSFNQTLPVKPNIRYLAAMDVKRKRGPSAARMAISILDKDGNRLTGADIRHAFVGDDWETARGILVTPAAADHAKIYVLTLDKDKNSAFLCDNVRLIPLGGTGELHGRVWQVKRPLYEPLLGNEPPGLAREGAMIWSHMLYVNPLRDVAARMGRRYAEREVYAHLAKHKLHPIRVPNSPLYAEYGVTTAIYPRCKPAGARSMLEPAAIDFYLEQVRSTLAGHPGRIWAVFAQDEAEEHAVREIMALVGKKEKSGGDRDFLAAIDREIRTRYGFGKFGLPGAGGRDEPFRWIAFRRWVNGRFRDRHARLAGLVRKNWPGIRLISTDPMGRLSPYEFSLQREYFDIFTQQFLPRSNPTRCPLGLYVKLIADLTGREVWPCVHVENYAYPATPDEIRELYSQVWRNGGSGFHLYLPDTANARKKKGDTRLMEFGEPRAYRAVLEIVDRAARQKRLKFPRDEGCRIFYSEYAHMAFANVGAVQPPMEACYTLLGPCAGSWFTITDEHRFADPDAASRARVMYLPYARVMGRQTRARLEAFVRAGGLLIIGDPDAFEYDLDGTPSRAERERLAGVKATGKNPRGTTISATPELATNAASKAPALRLMLLAAAHGIVPGPASRVIGTFADGSAAIVLHPLGKGQVMYFAASPFTAATLAVPDWQAFFRRLQAALGLRTGLDIWRFRFPPFETVDLPPPRGQCLTGNHVEWRENRQHLEDNIETGGTYTLAPPPDDAADAGGDTAIPFAAGDLTDRGGWPELEKVQAKSYQPYVEPLARWVDTWKKSGLVRVTFDFRTARPIDRLRLWFSGRLPAGRIEGSTDGKTWRELGRGKAVDAGADVLDQTLRANGTPCRYLRLVLPKSGNALLTLAEVEVWTAP